MLTIESTDGQVWHLEQDDSGEMNIQWLRSRDSAERVVIPIDMEVLTTFAELAVSPPILDRAQLLLPTIRLQSDTHLNALRAFEPFDEGDVQ